MKGLSLFASAGIGEAYLSEIGLDIVVSNELIRRRSDLHQKLYPNCHSITGDITKSAIFEQVMNEAEGVDFLLASPPCQGMSWIGKNKHQEEYIKDERNFLINYVFAAIERLSPKYVMIENVEKLLVFQLPYKGELHTVTEILLNRFGDEYEIDGRLVNSADYGVPQTRIRAIIKMYPKGTRWDWPKPIEKHITVRDAIGYLPSLEAGESSNIKWHYARPHSSNNVLCMKHTPEGCTAYNNPIYYPKKADGTKVKGFTSSYRRIKWDEPSPAITMRNDCISSQRNVHPGRKLSDGTYSDARVLTPLELMIIDSLPLDWNVPDDTPEILIRQVIGESIPPLMVKRLVEEIPSLKKMKAISLFSSAGIGELRLPKDQIDFVLANELLEQRANCYKYFYPHTEMLCGDILDIKNKQYIINKANSEQVDLLLATPPCQGLSTLGKNKVQEQYVNDRRNFLILEVLDIIDSCDFSYVLIENVPKFIEMYFPYKEKYYQLEHILNDKYSEKYNIEIQVLNAKDYGVPQSRPRAIIKMWKKGMLWCNPQPEAEITLEQAIGHLPSIEAGEDSGIPWHRAKKEVPRYVESLKHIPSGKSAINSPYHPLKADGSPITGFHNTFKRMNWDQPCPARTTFSGSFTSHNNIHPGRLLPDGTYSDARVLTLLETFIVSSIQQDITFPIGSTDRFIREIIGEAIPPLLLAKIISMIGK